MNARELLAQWPLMDRQERGDLEHSTTILRALALLAAVDESSDGLVRELRCMAADAIPESGIEQIADKAAARIVALEAELASVKAERDRLNSAVRWALGYNEGEPQFQPRAEGDPPYWWRNELMRRAAHPKDAP